MADIDIEQPACFYLGREYDLASKTVLDRPVMYDVRDLTTHGVVVGMTGSGKTGLCINLLEEAALDGVPCIMIDPKGDLTNMLLQFPELRPTDFLRWLNPEDARQKGLTLEEYSRQLAEQWRAGLAEWGQTPERIQRLQDSAEWRIYTPGSEAGLPLSILRTFTAPKGATTREALNQKIDATTTALLGLTGIASDPVQSREHILIAQLLLHSWGKGRDLDLPNLIAQIQAPPLRTIGAFDVDTFYPEKDRLKLAVALNNILAAPSFSTWITGEALDLSVLLSGGKKPRQLVFYIAHLEDSQRLFFLTLLLEEVLSWTRKQPGTTGLRAILYFDEVFGYLPPHPANPPTKTPLMTLLKQARAFGVGVLLATQNPVDLDYKALSNAGTWFIGKLQTERDKARLVEGLEGVAAEHGTLSDRGYLETVISSLSSRIFLLHNVHRPKPLLFKSRWALSFLRGPLTRDQVALLSEDRHQEPDAGKPGTGEPGAEGEPAAEGPPAAIPLCRKCQTELPAGTSACPKCGTANDHTALRADDREFKQSLLQTATAASRPPATAALSVPPVVPAAIAQFYLPVQAATASGETAQLVYQARLLGWAEVVFVDKRRGLDVHRQYRLLVEVPTQDQAVSWATAETIGETMAAAPQPGAHWGNVPGIVTTAKKLTGLKRAFVDFLYTNAKTTVLTNDELELVSQPGEDVLAFQKRCEEAARRAANEALAAEKNRLRPKFEALGAPMPDDPQAPAKDGAKTSSWLDMLMHPLGLGTSSAKPVSPPTTGADKRKETSRRKLESEYQTRRAAIIEKWRKVGQDYNEVLLTPRKADIQVTHFGLGWAPFRETTDAAGTKLVQAYK